MNSCSMILFQDMRRELGVSVLDVSEEEKELKQMVSAVCGMNFHVCCSVLAN